MKKMFFLFVMMISASLFYAQPSDKKSNTAISFAKNSIDYGTIKKGSEPLRKFHFKNNGDTPLIITNAKGSCGCTVPDYPKEPIMPGETNVIDVRYNTNKIGKFNKNVTVTTNDGESTVLTIYGEVIE
jgi:hypothetical protein